MKKFKRGPAWITRGYRRIIKPIRAPIDPDFKVWLAGAYADLLSFKIEY